MDHHQSISAANGTYNSEGTSAAASKYADGVRSVIERLVQRGPAGAAPWFGSSSGECPFW